MATRTSSRTAVVTLPTDTQIKIVREFHAPRPLVYKAWTTPELIKRWWHANRGKATLAEVDLRVGGKWRWVMVTPDGLEVAFHGEYRELIPNEWIVYTEVFEGAPDGEALNTLTLTESGGLTTAIMLMQLKSREDRDAILATGMEDGMQDALDLLEQVAAALA
ncbi:MAG: ATPase [Gammaproteobacteria bacterium RBG_16_66_13]|nr:MAG: ATPase [Gammaproteobacteria bacterium RBG_16_66_13]